VTIGGITFPVVKLHLEGGRVVITYAVVGPNSGAAGNCTVFGADGTGCWQGGWKVLPPVPAGQVWYVAYALTVYRVDTWGETAVVVPGEAT
jgi:hypothetical protein